jgi:PTS system nitrogen regulatory IIA component
MPLTLTDVVRLFDTTENAVRKWINEDNLPCEVIDDRYAFDRSELLEWATIRERNVSPSIFEAVNGDAVSESSLSGSLQRGGIAYDVKAPSKQALLRAIVEELPLPQRCDRDVLWQLFLARETLGTTALEGGIAVPHPRRPVVLDIDQPLVSLTFLAEAIDFQSLDGTPVDTLFAIVAPTVHEHLQLLARLASVLKDERVRDALRQRAQPEHIRAAVSDAERARQDRSERAV